LCVQIARGINALHELNIMHRDVKPANILVTKDWQLKLCDFGFGKLDQSLKQTAKVGTAIYRDPNVNFGKYSKKCDIYSVGLVYDTIFRG
jgi:serine/threonine protein kinase